MEMSANVVREFNNSIQPKVEEVCHLEDFIPTKKD